MTTHKKYFIQTFGCQANKADSERIAGDYQNRGYIETINWKEADEIVINTCSVRQRAEDRVIGFLYNIEKYLNNEAKKKKSFKIILTGCMLHHDKETLEEKMPLIDEFLPISEVGFNTPSIRKDKKHAFVPISNGCNSFCTYCIVPYSRGREVSRPMKDVINEVKKLVDSGYQEITLLGQNVNSYGLEKIGVSLRKKMIGKKTFSRKDLPSNESQYLDFKDLPPFVKLIQEISNFKGLKIIRFMSANPWDFHDELIAEIGKNKKIDRFVHIAVQSGSNNVLYRMNRGYTREDYILLIKKLKKADKNITVGTDIIVGFPGETDEEFNETLDLAKTIKWKVGFVNIYSPRPGTAADKLYKDDIPHIIKKKRWLILEKEINRKNLSNRPKVV